MSSTVESTSKYTKEVKIAQSIADELLHFNIYTTCLVLGSTDGKTVRIPQKAKIRIRDIESNDLMFTITNLRDGVQWALITPTITDPEVEKVREKCYRG